MTSKKAFGDFQTPADLACRVIELVHNLYGKPDVVIEPTVGKGSFLSAALAQWKKGTRFKGYEINPEYVTIARNNLQHSTVEIFQADFFTEDWQANLSQYENSRLLLIGNPPWVTNSELGQLESNNLPQKNNLQGLRGYDARTGKANFDIAEWVLIRLLELLPPQAALAMLCKTMTARKVLRHFWKLNAGREHTNLFHIDAKADFNVAVDACLLYVSGKKTENRTANVYTELNATTCKARFGYMQGDLVSNLDYYAVHKELEGGSSGYTWRSGIKHDAASIMEFTPQGDHFINGLGEQIDLEADYIYPLLKSSDLGNGRFNVRKFVLVTQQHIGEDTSSIANIAPKTWEYLTQHANILKARKSSIYRNQPNFAIFGVGSYSFAPWKIAISGLYKRLSFVLVPSYRQKPVMVDDTCNFIPCQTQQEAEFILELLLSPTAQEFLSSLIFMDAKRPITIDILRRLSFLELARKLGKLTEFQQIMQQAASVQKSGTQKLLLMAPEK